MSEQSTITASISCLCGKVSAQQIVLASLVKSTNEVPLCHCNACRATSGVLCTSYYSLLTPDPTLPPHSKSHYGDNQLIVSNPYLREYIQSTRLSRWFCGICGAHVLAQLKPENRYLIAAGLVVPAESSISESGCVAVHYGVGETRDGSLSIFMPGSVNVGSSTACLIESADAVTSPPPPSELPHDVGQHQNENYDEDSLQAQCHCGGTSFTVTRPNDQSKEPWSPWPDMIVPYHSGSPKNSEDVKWWLRANDTKYFAGTCACNSCRLASGFPIQCWAFIPKANLLINQGTDALTYDTGTMKQFESSPGVYREFCNRCGATVFWHCDERPGVVDVSVGLLRSVSGARADDWLEWATGRVSFAEDALDKDLIELLETGLKNSVN